MRPYYDGSDLRTKSNKGARSIALVLVAIALFAASIAKGQGQGQSSEPKRRATALAGMATREPAHNSNGPSVEQLKTLHEQGRDAALKGDDSFFEKYLSEDYVGIRADGSLATKDQYIQMLKSGAIKYETIDERDVKVSLYGDTGIVNVLAFLKLMVNAKPITGMQRATFVWVKQESNWKEVFFQATQVSPRSRRPGDNLGHDAPPAPR